MIDFNDDKQGYSAVIYIMESSNSVVVHFGGFNDLSECRYFSSHIMKDFGIDQLLNIPPGVTLH
jgi:hypothetical protein